MHTVFHAPNANTLMVCLDGQKIQHRNELFTTLAELLEFPNFFGNNFDALDDMLNDLSWIKSEHVILYIFRANKMFSNLNEFENKRIFLDIVASCSNAKLDIVMSPSNIQHTPNV